jgi:hypothetical protein
MWANIIMHAIERELLGLTKKPHCVLMPMREV